MSVKSDSSLTHTGFTAQLYCPDTIGIWHAVAVCNPEFKQVRGKCRHDFMPTGPMLTKRPHPDKYCSGCLGAEEREEKARQKEGAKAKQ
jgi:hypothetical protein